MELLKANEIDKQFANHKALDKVSINVPENSIFGLLGPNGAGKTTLIRIINQITGPDSGEVFFKGRKLHPDDVYNIGYLPEERGLYKKMKVGEQAMYLAQLKGLSRTDAMKKLKHWFTKFEILGWWDKKVEELSKGMQQKIQFVTTVIHEPELLIFDEPFSGFDPINTNLLKQEILELKEKGSTIIFSTHNMASVEELCDHISLIHRSKNILNGPMTDIKSAYRSNTFDINYKGDAGKLKGLLNGDFQLIKEEVQKDNTNSARIKMVNESKPNDLLNLLIPQIEIVAYNEVIPSMNDIFIRVVEEKNLEID